MGHLGTVYRLIFSPDGQTLASISDDRTIKLWKLETRKPIYTLQESSEPVLTLAFSPDGQTLASGSADGIIAMWE